MSCFDLDGKDGLIRQLCDQVSLNDSCQVADDS
jgi:hypothetical protein